MKYTENELSLDLISRGENGKERSTKEWIDKGYLEIGRNTYKSFIAKVEQYYTVIEKSGRGTKRVYTLLEKERIEIRKMNHKGDVLNIPAMMDKLKKRCFPKIKYDSFDYMDTQTKNISCICLTCKYEWVSSYGQLTARKTNCPLCVTSKGERTIHNVLSKNNIEFKWQYQFEGLLTEKGNDMTIDFYLIFDNLPIVIEYHGKQHYESIDYFGGDSMFQTQQWRDERKREYFKDNNIKYLEIPYSCKNIEVVVLEFLLQLILSKKGEII